MIFKRALQSNRLLPDNLWDKTCPICILSHPCSLARSALPPSAACAIMAAEGGDTMTKQELETALEQICQEFSKEVQFVADDPYSKDPVTKGELYESHKQTFYALRNFKKAILEYLD